LPCGVSTVADITTHHFYSDVIHPYRRKYPDDTYLYWLARLKQNWNDPNQHFFVSTAGSRNEIAAWAQFLRKTASAKKDTAQPDVSDLPPNRAAHEEREDILERQYEYIAHEWSGQCEASSLPFSHQLRIF